MAISETIFIQCNNDFEHGNDDEDDDDDDGDEMGKNATFECET